MTKPSILLVEDDEIIAQGVAKRLRGLGYTVAGHATTGEEAVEFTAGMSPDLVLMDIHLGAGIDGVTAAASIRDHSGVPVVFLTAHSDGPTLQRAKLTEPYGYVLKPFHDQELYTAIEIALYRHRMAQQRQDNEQRLAATLASIGDGTIATDESGRVRYLNVVAERLTGWDSASAVGRPVCEVLNLVEEHTHTAQPNPVEEVLATGQTADQTVGITLLNKTGSTHPIDLSIAPVRDESGHVSGAILVFRDVTSRMQLENMLRQAQKMETVGLLTSGIAHDFNNIMSVICGYGEILQMDDRLHPDQREMLNTIQAAGNRAADLTKQLMAFSRKQTLVPVPINLNRVIRDMEGILKRLVGENITFVTTLAEDLGTIKADPTQVGQILLNLVANARDAMSSANSGKLVITTANFDAEDTQQFRIPKPQGRLYVMLSVTDSGMGMPPEVIAKIFKPFFTTKEAGRGTGIGLATVLRIVAQLAGHIEVTSEVGVGTTFHLFFPLEQDRQSSPAELAYGESS